MLSILCRRPYKLTLLICGNCNLRCRICSIWKRRQQYISLDEIKQIWSAFQTKPCWVNISGGEPTLNPELSQILEYFLCMPRPLLITLTTNGQQNIAPVIAPLFDKNKRSLLYISVSLDGDKLTHDQSRGRAGAYARACHTIQSLRILAAQQAALSVGISTTLTPDNIDNLIPFLEKWMSVLPVNINLPQFSAYYGNAGADHFINLPTEMMIHLLQRIVYLQPKFNLEAIIKINFLHSAIQYLKGIYRPIPCSSLVDNVFITADLDRVDCSLRFRNEVLHASREAKLDRLKSTIRRQRKRGGAHRTKLANLDCERTCHTPCEVYVHILSALCHPYWALKLLMTYLYISIKSWFFGPRELRGMRADENLSSPTMTSEVSSPHFKP
jgi:MoaA/NifB/PqqE/SkfB family radical SAM enzyme